MPAAPPQGFDPGIIGTLNTIEGEENIRASSDESLMNENNSLLNSLLKQMEEMTGEVNIDGGKLVDNN